MNHTKMKNKTKNIMSSYLIWLLFAVALSAIAYFIIYLLSNYKLFAEQWIKPMQIVSAILMATTLGKKQNNKTPTEKSIHNSLLNQRLFTYISAGGYFMLILSLLLKP